MNPRSSQLFRGLLVGSAIACFGILPSQAELAATISVDISTDPGGGFLYEYLIENLPESTVSINAFVLDVGTDADLQNIGGPDGWIGDYDPTEDPYEMVWIPNDAQYDIPIGGDGTFSFTSPLAAEPLPYFIANLAPDGSDLGSMWGDIAAPGIPIPEPTTLTLSFLLLASITLARRMNRCS